MPLVSGFRPSFLMPDFLFQSELLNPALATSSALRMVVGVNGVSILVKKENEILALKYWGIPGTDQSFQSVESQLRTVFGEEILLELPFVSKVCALSSAASTLVPRRLFDSDDLPQYFKLLMRSGEDRTYGFEKIAEFDCYLVWAAETGLVRLCEQYFTKENIKHLAAPLLRACQELAPREGYAVFANLRGQKVQITVFERQNLVFFNSFDFTKPNDLLYYILLAYKQFDLNPLDIPLTLSGTLTEDAEIFQLLLRYVRPMRFPPMPGGYQWPEENNLPAHFWFDIANV